MKINHKPSQVSRETLSWSSMKHQQVRECTQLHQTRLAMGVLDSDFHSTPMRQDMLLTPSSENYHAQTFQQ